MPALTHKLHGVYRPATIDAAREETGRRAAAYAGAVARYIKGDIDLSEVYRAWATPMYGAFGEELR